MTPAAVLAILVAAGEATSPAGRAMVGAAGDVVGDLGRVDIVESTLVSDAEALRVERDSGVRAIVAVTWEDADHLHAHLRLHAARTDRWIDRALGFAPVDTPAERGRALGFAIASMLPEGDPSLPLAPRAPEPTIASPAPAPAPRAAEAPAGRNVLEATVIAGAGLGGPAGGVGARLAYERFVARATSLGGALASRLGRIDDPDARVATSSIALGAALWALTPDAGRRYGLAVRGEVLLVHEAVERTATNGVAAWRADLLPGTALTITGTARVARPLEVVVSGGAEVTFGTTDVTVVAGAPAGGTARLPALRALVQVGVRARF